ncbi:aminopeptidase N [uncultured Psychrosphaera sp.]|uniref:aminopeptidase N n=1 Tax=uncultured Psychrosphaera sp. TaxID=1403522 RepID=UPI0026290A7A|nr:aminopeptidase N [uncultured Psychrosphaera sp.]
MTTETKYLKDYQIPEFLIPKTELFFNLDDEKTLVRSKLQIKRNVETAKQLVLDCEVQQVLTVLINGTDTPFTVEQEQLKIDVELVEFELEIEVIVDPINNTALEGLYKSAGVFCTQCEAESFRRITPYLDRPDVLSVFTVIIFADADLYPYMLSNGNLIDSGLVEEDDESHKQVRWTKWHDPHPKPSYLFALVAGDFDLLTDEFVTKSGRKVELELFVDKGNLHLGHHAMASLVKSMAWDEQRYGLEYDLDKYMVVAVDFFNMGAMENKGLNVFNSKYVLADLNTATDIDYHGIEAVIGHEYFHNWTGNRVTCRDWFQLSLKEGLTVFRDQQFSADMGSEVIERISHANVMRTMQFAEDAGPMAHPIRPEKVMEMNNFYTVTVYDKGAEVIRMMHSLLGESGFRAGMDLYFKRHDGNAVTCDDFVSSMADANSKDLTQFQNWYSQAGTPNVVVSEKQTDTGLELTLAQTLPTRPAEEQNKPLVIPVKYELLANTDGRSLERGTVIFDKSEQVFSFSCAEPATLVLFENFSAPVKVHRKLTQEQLIHIVKYASDAFCRWDSMQSLWLQQINGASDTILDEGRQGLIEVIEYILNNDDIETSIKAELLTIPSYTSIAETFDVINPSHILKVKNEITLQIIESLAKTIKALVQELTDIEDGYIQTSVAKRRLKHVLLSYLSHSSDSDVESIIRQVYLDSTNMTEKVSALESARVYSVVLLDELLENMDKQFADNVLVFDKMTSAVARIPHAEVYRKIAQWAEHALFSDKNPNRVRSLFGAFVMNNPEQFHDESGKGYQFLADFLKKMDKLNPQLASRMISPLLSWQRYEPVRKELMRQQLIQLSKLELSKDLYEKLSSALG